MGRIVGGGGGWNFWQLNEMQEKGISATNDDAKVPSLLT